jgi:hypothetical protein
MSLKRPELSGIAIIRCLIWIEISLLCMAVIDRMI